ncbi:MAG: DUF2235 domain-containing protein [Sneathiella sp.]
MQQRKPKKIILLSDGTGNSAAARDKSNVWRIYQSLDLGPDETGFYEQIAFYDNGVGTSNLKVRRLLGAAFGFGLSRNVRQLYTELCRHYFPGDKIYIFGFSRGAFTARVLAHFIEICGILDTNKKIPLWPFSLSNTNAPRTASLETENGFNRAISKAYKSYRNSYWRGRQTQNKSTYFIPRIVSTVFRFLRNKVLRSDVLCASDFKQAFCHLPEADKPAEKIIEFIGVWDTVDAVGLPIDELANFLDKYLYPYRFKDQHLGKDVQRAAQALAIDDERQTFHPLLWDQSTEVDQERISQVWFTGMHSNVGGGYPEDNLSAIALSWMIDCINQDNVGQSGLHFNPVKVMEFNKLAVPTGKLYNSRKGLGAFYRYKPRNIEALTTHGAFGQADFGATPAVIHHSVLDRIREQNAGYAPNGIPENFEVCGNNGTVKPRHLGHQFYESLKQASRRKQLLVEAKDVMFWGRVTYYSMFACLISIVVFPLIHPRIPGLLVKYGEEGAWASAERFMSGALSFLSEKASLLGSFDMPNYWLESWNQNVFPFGILVFFFLLFFFMGLYTKRVSHRFAESAWAGFKGNNTHIPEPKNGFMLLLARKIRKWSIAKTSHRFIAQKLVPFSFFLTIAWVLILLVVRTESFPLLANVEACALYNSEDTSRILKLDEEKIIAVKTSSPCIVSGIKIEEGKIYSINIEIKDKWMDASYPASIRGIETLLNELNPIFIGAMPLKRHLELPWFALTAEIGKDSGEVFPLNRKGFVFKATNSGPLYLYVNDAIRSYGLPESMAGWDEYYKNNRGTASFTMMRIK